MLDTGSQSSNKVSQGTDGQCRGPVPVFSIAGVYSACERGASVRMLSINHPFPFPTNRRLKNSIPFIFISFYHQPKYLTVGISSMDCGKFLSKVECGGILF